MKRAGFRIAGCMNAAFLAIAIAVLILSMAALLILLTSVQVRLDTGELRYCVVGIPLKYERQPPRTTVAIQDVTHRDPPIEARWVRVGSWWRWGSHPPYGIPEYYHPYASAWLSVSPSVARLAFVELAQYLKEGAGEVRGYPPCSTLLYPYGLTATDSGSYCVAPGWRRGPYIVDYLYRTGNALDADLPPPPADGPDADSAAYALLLAARRGDSSEVVALLQAGADARATAGFGWSALHEAAALGHKAAVEALLGASADPSSRDGLDWTPLHWAAARGDEALVSLLCARGAEVNAGNTQGYTPLHLAADRGHLGAVRALIAADADVNATGGNGYTPLILAAASGEAEVVVALLDAGADPSRQDNEGLGAWQWLTARGNTAVARLFLSREDTRKCLGKNDLASALQTAFTQGNTELEGLLREHGATQ